MQLAILITIVASLLSVFGFFKEISLPELNWLSSPLVVVCLAGLPAMIYGCLRCFTQSKDDGQVESPEQLKFVHASAGVSIGIWLVTAFVFCIFLNWKDQDWIASLGSDTIRFLVILAPILTSISCVWFTQSYYASKHIGRSISETFSRLKVYYLMTLTPLFLLLLIKDLTASFSSEQLIVTQAVLLPLGMVLTGVFMPHIVCWILPSISIRETELGNRLLTLANESRTSVADVRIWGTGNRVLNAFVVGLLPYGRTVLLTDRLVKEFDQDEITAVFLHEVGHAKHHHLVQRLAAAATPFFFTYAIGQVCLLPEFATIGLAILTSLIGLSFVARLLEFEADAFAVDELIKRGHHSTQYLRILHRIRLENPQSDRASWLHPSVSDRIRRIRSTSPIEIPRSSKQL